MYMCTGKKTGGIAVSMWLFWVVRYMGDFYFLSTFLHISNSLQWICIAVIIYKRLVLKFIWNYSFMVVILQSNLCWLCIECCFFCASFRLLPPLLSLPCFQGSNRPFIPSSQALCVGGFKCYVCTENNSNSTNSTSALSWPHAHSDPWTLHAVPSGMTSFPTYLWQTQSYVFFSILLKILFP